MAAAVRFRTPDTELVLVVTIAFLCAAATEYIGVHAVFGAFVAGTMLRQVPRLSHETVHKLESFVFFSILAPIFFGIVGLKVDLWSLGGGKMLRGGAGRGVRRQARGVHGGSALGRHAVLGGVLHRRWL